MTGALYGLARFCARHRFWILAVPARMIMLGKHTWYLPRWPGRILPRISIEGEEYFQARDQLSAARQAQYSGAGPTPLINAKDS